MGVLLAFVLQVVYIPLHLAHEEHFDADGVAAGSLVVEAVPVEHDHGHHHNHDSHSRHAALDHDSDFLALTAPLRHLVFDFHAVAALEGWAAPAIRPVFFIVHPEAKPPRLFARFGECPRGPPAAA